MNATTYESAEPLIADLPMTGGELLILRELDQAQGTFITKADIAKTTGLQGGHSNTIEVLVGRIRRKLIAANSTLAIETVRERGYRLVRIGGDA